MFKIKLLNNWDDYYVDYQVPLSYWAELGLKFLHSNANVHDDKDCPEYHTHNKISPQIERRYSIAIDYQISPLSVIQLCLKNVSCFASLQELCVAKGGCSYLKCTRLCDDSCYPFPIYELPEQQSNELLKVFILALDGERTGRLVKEAFETKIEEIYEEMGGGLYEEGDGDSSTSSSSLASNLLERDPEDSTASFTHSETDHV